MLIPVYFNHCFMSILPRTVESRRGFFRAAARYALLALLSVAASLAARRPQTAPGQRCVNLGICRSCGVFAGCGLPQALSAKRAQERG
jgi:hypothetical protein